MVDNLDQQVLVMNAAILRQIWVRRNMVVFEDKFESPKSIVKKSKVMLETYQMAQILVCILSTSPANHATGNQSEHNRKWQPLATNQFKFNWDAAVNSRTNTTGLGVIIRDCKGNILASACYNKPSQYKPVIVEALALKTTMLICQDLRIN